MQVVFSFSKEPKIPLAKICKLKFSLDLNRVAYEIPVYAKKVPGHMEGRTDEQAKCYMPLSVFKELIETSVGAYAT